mgnify:CR=1 FL=1
MRAISQWPWGVLAAVFLNMSAALAQTASVPAGRPELIYCADRMTHEEREAYRARMRAASGPEQKEAIRAAHRAEMQARAAGQGEAYCEPPGRQWRGGNKP